MTYCVLYTSLNNLLNFCGKWGAYTLRRMKMGWLLRKNTKEQAAQHSKNMIMNSYWLFSQLLVCCFAMGTFVNYHEIHETSFMCRFLIWFPLAPFYKPLLPSMWYILFISLSDGKSDLRSVEGSTSVD